MATFSVRGSVVMSCDTEVRPVRPYGKALDLTQHSVSAWAAGLFDYWDRLASFEPELRK